MYKTRIQRLKQQHKRLFCYYNLILSTTASAVASTIPIISFQEQYKLQYKLHNQNLQRLLLTIATKKKRLSASTSIVPASIFASKSIKFYIQSTATATETTIRMDNTRIIHTEKDDTNNNNTNENRDAIIEKKKHLRKSIRLLLQQQQSNDTIKQLSNSVWSKIYTLSEFYNAKTIGIFLSMPQNEINTSSFIKYCTFASTPAPKTLYVPIVGKNFELINMEFIRFDNNTNNNSNNPLIATNSTTANKTNDSVITDTSLFKEEDDDDDVLFYKSWPKNKWNIPEPPESLIIESNFAKYGDIDLIIVPGVAFDTKCNRLGQGKGYYDRFLSHIMMKPSSTTSTTTSTETSTDTTTKTNTNDTSTSSNIESKNEQQGQQGQQIRNNINNNNNNNDRRKPFLIGVGFDCQLLQNDTYIPVNEYDFQLDMIVTPSYTIINKKEEET